MQFLRNVMGSDAKEGKSTKGAQAIPKKKVGFAGSNYNSWVGRVYRSQQSKITPEIREKLKKAAEKTARINRSKRKGKKLRLVSAQANRAWTSGNQKISRASRAPKRNKEEVAFSAAAEMKQIECLRRQLSDEENDEQMARYDDIDDAFEEASVQESEVSEILKELQTEPATDEETKAKFGLYETFLTTVEAIRKETFTFWDETKGDFEGNGRKRIDSNLKSIDGHDNMAIDFDGRKWFVHGMTVKAVSNRDKISKILKNINEKLELMGSQTECPICLDPFSAQTPTLKSILTEARLLDYEKKFAEAKFEVKALMDSVKQDNTWRAMSAKVATATAMKPGHMMRLKRSLEDAVRNSEPKQVHTLVCCHQVCMECWSHYAKVAGLNKCPLCRADDFLSIIAREADSLPEEEKDDEGAAPQQK